MAPRLREVMRILVGSDSEVGYCIHTLSDYLPDGVPEPTTISFMEAQAIVSEAGDVLIGWTIDSSDKNEFQSPVEFEIEVKQHEKEMEGSPSIGRKVSRRKSLMDSHDNQAARDLAAKFQASGHSLNVSWITNPERKLDTRPW